MKLAFSDFSRYAAFKPNFVFYIPRFELLSSKKKREL